MTKVEVIFNDTVFRFNGDEVQKIDIVFRSEPARLSVFRTGLENYVVLFLTKTCIFNLQVIEIKYLRESLVSANIKSDITLLSDSIMENIFVNQLGELSYLSPFIRRLSLAIMSDMNLLSVKEV